MAEVLAIRSHTCPCCKTEKPVDSFSTKIAYCTRKPYVSVCKECVAAKKRAAVAKEGMSYYRRITWPSKLRTIYGIEPEDYYRMLKEQDGGCAICATKVPCRRQYKNRKMEMFFIDHCHSTGKVRGLLCARCNKGIGMFEDNIELMGKAISYLGESLGQ